MVDIHSHILFGIDDGAKDLNESIKLCKQASKLGYKDILCTSHYIKGKFENKKYFQNFKILRAALKKEKIDLNIHLGNEIYLDMDTFCSLENKKFNTLAQTNYILVEFPKGLLFKVKYNMITSLIEKGYRIIIAHIERYPELSKSEILKIKELGVKIQSNISAIPIILKRNSSFYSENIIDILASDAHNIKHRNYFLEKEFTFFKIFIGEEKLKNLTDVFPRQILNIR